MAESDRRLAALAPGERRRRSAGRRTAGRSAFSGRCGRPTPSIKDFLYPHMYRHPEVMAVRARRTRSLRDLFRALHGRARRDAGGVAADLTGDDEPRLARRVADYIAGMTDRYAHPGAPAAV